MFDRRGPGGDGRLDHLAEEIGLGPGGVLGRELDVRAIARRPPHARHRLANDLVLVHLQLVLAMDGAGGQEDVDPRPLGRTHGFPSAVDVFVAAAGQPANRRPADRLGDLATASKSPGEAMGKPASITSTPNSTSAWAISIFSARFMLAPGDCSPSRSVVSKMMIRREGFVSCRSCSSLVMGRVLRNGVPHWMVEERELHAAVRSADPRSAWATPTTPSWDRNAGCGVYREPSWTLENEKKAQETRKTELSIKKPQGFLGLGVRLFFQCGSTREPYGRGLAKASNNNGNRLRKRVTESISSSTIKRNELTVPGEWPSVKRAWRQAARSAALVLVGFEVALP